MIGVGKHIQNLLLQEQCVIEMAEAKQIAKRLDRCQRLLEKGLMVKMDDILRGMLEFKANGFDSADVHNLADG